MKNLMCLNVGKKITGKKQVNDLKEDKISKTEHISVNIKAL